MPNPEPENLEYLSPNTPNISPILFHLLVWKWVFYSHALAVAFIAIIAATYQLTTEGFPSTSKDLFAYLIIAILLLLPAFILAAFGYRCADCHEKVLKHDPAGIDWASNAFAAFLILALGASIFASCIVSSMMFTGFAFWFLAAVGAPLTVTLALAWTHVRINQAARAIFTENAERYG